MGIEFRNFILRPDGGLAHNMKNQGQAKMKKKKIKF